LYDAGGNNESDLPVEVPVTHPNPAWLPTEQFYGEDGVKRTLETYNQKGNYWNCRYFLVCTTGVHGGGIVRGVYRDTDKVMYADDFGYNDPNALAAGTKATWRYGRVDKSNMWGWFSTRG
jgi:hypothetical protein